MEFGVPLSDLVIAEGNFAGREVLSPCCGCGLTHTLALT